MIHNFSEKRDYTLDASLADAENNELLNITNGKEMKTPNSGTKGINFINISFTAFAWKIFKTFLLFVTNIIKIDFKLSLTVSVIICKTIYLFCKCIVK